MAHHANDGSASRILRGMLRMYGYRNDPEELAAALALPATQSARCGAGEHDEAVAERGRVTYIGFGRRVEPGARYCRWCKVMLPAGDA